jgi:hypothetical protein
LRAAATLGFRPRDDVVESLLPAGARALLWLPDAEALRGTRIALHETLGQAWYPLQSAAP